VLAEPDIGQRLADPFGPLPGGSDLEPVERLAHQLLDLPGRVERGERVLVDELKVAPDRAQRLGRATGELLAAERIVSLSILSGSLIEILP
jgi:hypothetical protein